MNKYFLTYFLLSLLHSSFSFAQEKRISKKEIQQKISKSRDELSNLNCEKSLSLAEEALMEAYKISDNLLIAKAYNVIGSNFLEFADTQKAKNYYNKALLFANKTDNDTVSILSYLTYVLFKNNKLKKRNFEELQKINIQLNKAKEIAEESTQLKSQFVSTITHELRTPLYGVIGITDIIANEHPELKDSEHLNSLKFSAKYLLSLVNDVLQIYKISEKKIILENTKFNIREKLESIKNSLQILSVKNGNSIQLEIDENIPKILIGDSLRLSQIFMNLINNSLKFTDNGNVFVKANLVEKENDSCAIKFQVIDNGIGISKEDHEKVFQEFVQIERREDDYQGTGLGLPIVKKLIELFGGEIELESEEGVGTTISFTITFETSIEEELENQQNRIDYKEREIKILLVEDNKINQVVTEKLLNSFNFKTVVVADGFKAVEMIKTQSFDLVLMDINMPKINGFETTKLIRAMGIETPIIALTAFDKQEVEAQALESGMSGVLIKPFEKEDLYQVITNLIK